MTSMTMYSEWTAPTMLSSMWAEPTTRRTRAAHRVSGWVAVVDTTVRLLYPLVATAAVIFAALMWPGTAHSDPVDTTANAAGVNAGPIKTSIAEFGQSLCPMLVKPGSNLATNASQLQGNGALTNTIAGAATGMAIQMECPAIMSQLANGNMSSLSSLLQLMSAKPTPATGLQLQVPAF